MRSVVETYAHQTGEHCASTALRNLLHFRGLTLSEGMIVGLASGLGFYYIRRPDLSPSHMFHGRTLTLESDFGRNTAMGFEDRIEPDDARAWRAVKGRIDAGEPVMVSTDPFYLGYHRTTSHFPGHRAVVVGYDDEADEVYIADRKFESLQVCRFDELRRARNASDHPHPCQNQYGDFEGRPALGRPLDEAIRTAVRRNCEAMLTPRDGATVGVGGMRALARDLPRWTDIDDWSWAARFGYQVVVKRGAGGSFFRSLYADFLAEAGRHVPALEPGGFAGRMQAVAAHWRELAATLKEQSERESCAPELFARAGEQVGELASEEESIFRALQAAVGAEGG